MEYNSNSREQLHADERRVQAVVADVLKAVHDGTLHTNQTMIDLLGFDGVSPAVTNPYANDLLRTAVETFQAAKSRPELTVVAEGYALAAAAFGHATQSVHGRGGETVPGGQQNLKDRLSEYQQLAAHDDPSQRSLFEAASKVTLAAYGKPLAPAPERSAGEVAQITDGRKPRDGRFNKLATAGKLAAAIAGATVAVAGSAQMAAAATRPTPEKPAPSPNDASSPAAVDLGTITTKAEPQKYEAPAKAAAAEASPLSHAEVSAKTSASPASPDQSSSSRPATAQNLPAAPTQEVSPTNQPAVPQSQTDATSTPAPAEQTSSQSARPSDKQPDAAPATPRPHASEQPSATANNPDAPTTALSATPPDQHADAVKLAQPASSHILERQDNAHPVESTSSTQQKQEVPVIDVTQQVDLGSLGKAPAQDAAPDVHVATPAANTHAPIVKAQPFDTGMSVDLRDIEHAPDSTPQPINLEKSDTESAPDLSQIAATLKKATPQEYTPATPAAPAPAAPSPDQQAAPAPAETAPVPEAQKPNSEQQDYSTAAQKLIDQGGRWGRIGQAMKFFMEDPDLHFTPSQASGFIGNLLGEGSELDPTMHQVGGPAFGIAQWEAGRLAALKQFGGDKYDQLDVQLQFIKHELLTSEQGSLSKLREVPNDRKAAASIAVKFYERPSVPREAERRAYADSVGDTFNAQYQQVTSSHNAAPAARMVVGTEIKTVFNQCDPAWGDIKVDGVRTCDMGCGPTDVAMVVNALAADTNITPKDVYEYVTQRGSWLAGGQGTSYDGVIDAAQHWGVKGYQLNNDALKNIDTYRSILSNGGLIMVAGKGPAGNAAASLPFVSSDIGAHFVIIRGMDQNGNFLVTDSYPKTRDTNTTPWSANELMSKVFGAVAYTK